VEVDAWENIMVLEEAVFQVFSWDPALRVITVFVLLQEVELEMSIVQEVQRLEVGPVDFRMDSLGIRVGHALVEEERPRLQEEQVQEGGSQ
jgi:hypothetical protein